MKQIILLITLLITFFIQAQEKLNFNLNGENIEFTISQEQLYVEYEASQKLAILRIANDEFEGLTNNSAILKMTDLKGTYQERRQGLKGKISTDFQRVEPVLIYKDGTRQIAKGELSVKLKANASLNEIFKDLDFTFQSNEFEKNLFLVKLDLETSKLLLLVNQLQNDNRIEFIEPNFLRLIKTHTNDPFFNNQWSINNQGYLGGTVDADMDVEEAWAYSTGNNIVVAVIDEGVDLIHPDLTANLLPGFDATGNGSNGAPNEDNDDAHGTACAGIIAAIADNTTGTVGIAYNAKILPVRIAFSNGFPLGDNRRAWVSNDTWLANGINWAWQNGADILSNSWSMGSTSATVTIAINNAVNNGRVDTNGNPRGSVVLFSSGNDPGGNGNPVSFPANLENVISVGASSICDTRKDLSSCDGEFWGSNFGSSLDIVAPGVQIYTTDISGSNGYRFGDYISNFNGTSSACPNAAGVVALILSADPNLTQQQARGILERNTDKVNGYSYSNTSGQPNGTWNSEVGYGRVNALKAVEEVILGNMQLIGNNTVCNSNTFYSLSQVPNGVSVNWVVSSNLQKISSNSNSITVQANGEGEGFIEAILSTGTVRKEVWVGQAKITKTTFGSCYEPNYRISATYPDAALEFKVYHNGTTTYHSGSAHYEFSSDSYNLQDGESTTVYISIRNNCGWSQSYPVLVYKPTLCDCGYNDPSCGGSGGPPSPLSNSLSSNTILHPNPADQTLYVNSNSLVVENKKDTVFQIELFDLNGRLFFRTTTKEVNHEMDVSMLKDGLYILHLSNGKKRVIEKLIIKH
ncbi:putative secreted protein (Por secretion system target) [Gillisia sp. Hel_I_86]|uniref:S8 family peptidase n=1 Tax=Gillisia sp. Hel_I_86 TaxID=1249981 RepID=UPI00119AF5CB|nr:S8 family peptidase [Gillisia sp. Hel_I_86]TVZ28762.1 putative secreted protein (Por secretion system target) [Gillisia sp. Hel_I_86]